MKKLNQILYLFLLVLFSLQPANAAGVQTQMQTRTQAQNQNQNQNGLESTYYNCELYDIDNPTNASYRCNGSDTNERAIKKSQRNNSTGKPTLSARGGGHTATVAIDINNLCRWVDSSSQNTQNEDVFIPFKTDDEWTQFVNNAPSSHVLLKHCARSGPVTVPPNDPAGQSDKNYKCYSSSPSGRTYTVSTYGREGDVRSLPAAVGQSFSCKTSDGKVSFTKKVSSVRLLGCDADRTGTSGKCIGKGTNSSISNRDWMVTSVTYSGLPSRINGSCGSANGRTLTSVPSNGERCSRGSVINTSGEWRWQCKGYFGGSTASCSARKGDVYRPCPPITTPSMQRPYLNGYYDLVITGMGVRRIWASSHHYPAFKFANFYGNTCRSHDIYGNKTLGKGPKLASCAAYNYLRRLPGWSKVGYCNATGDYTSPLKVNLKGRDAVMNSTTPTDFYLTLKDKRIMEGHVTGGLNSDEGWLMIRRTKGPLVYKNGALNANNWFGDRDKRTVSGHTDLAETFAKFIVKDEEGNPYIPLKKLSETKRQKLNAYSSRGYKIAATNPSKDLRILDANNVEHYASDYFTRIYINYRNVVEYDGNPKQPESRNNVILSRSTALGIDGTYTAVVDQWFLMDLPNNLEVVEGVETKSKILPAKAKWTIGKTPFAKPNKVEKVKDKKRIQNPFPVDPRG